MIKTLDDIKGFDGYLNAFGAVLGKKANDALSPLHVPGRDPLPYFSGYTLKPYPAQAHLIAGGKKLLQKRNAAFIIGECGTGKTIMSELAIHEHACLSGKKGGHGGKYRAIVICPNHLIGKWCREISRTIPGAIVRRFGGDKETDEDDDRPQQAWKDFLRMLDYNVVRRMPGGKNHEVANGARWTKPSGPEWYVVGRNQIKFYPKTRGLGEKHIGFDGKEELCKPVRHAVTSVTLEKDATGRTIFDGTGNPKYIKTMSHMPVCPKCGGLVKNNDDPVSWAMIHKKKAKLYTCNRRYMEEVVASDRQNQNGADRIYFDSSTARHGDFMRYSGLKTGATAKAAGKLWIIKECGEPLWQYTSSPYRWAMAHIIQRKMRRFFNYLVVDECHEQKDAKSIQSKAFSKVWSATDKMFALTGTFINGYAHSIYSLLMRMAPGDLIARGFEWGDEMSFVEEYGRVDTIVSSKAPIETVKTKGTGRTVQVGKVTTTQKVAPGVMPTLFGHIVMPISMFITLEELADHLPNLTEVLDEGCVSLPDDIMAEYERIESTLAEKIASMAYKGGMKLMGTMLQTLLTYPDHPYGWEPMFEEKETIGYWEKPVGDDPAMMTTDNWKGVVSPFNFDLTDRILPKEQHLVDICKRHVPQGHRVWVYIQSTVKHNVMPRLQEILTKAGFRCGILNAYDVEPTKREEWVRANGDKYDVILSHPKLVSTGLDLFMLEDEDRAAYETARYKFNFNVLDFFQTGYNLFDVRQASRRSWRLGQMWDCFVYYQYYRNTMQHRAMELASRKLEAALQIEGSFSEEGLASLSSDASAQMTLCKSLSEKIDTADIQRKWPKINAKAKRSAEPDPDDDIFVPREEKEETEQDDNETLPPGSFVMLNSRGSGFLCKVRRNHGFPQPYIEAVQVGLSTSLPITITIDEVRRDGWKLDHNYIDDDTQAELCRDGFVFSSNGDPEGVHEVSRKHRMVGEVPFDTGVPEPGIKSPLDSQSMDKQLVAETVVAYAPKAWFDKLIEQQGNTDEKSVTKRSATASWLDDWIDGPPEAETVDEWEF